MLAPKKYARIRIQHEFEEWLDKSVLVIPNSDPWDRFVYPYLTLMSDSYSLLHVYISFPDSVDKAQVPANMPGKHFALYHSIATNY